MRIRPASESDRDRIRTVHLQAFPTPAEADLVDRLCEDGETIVSLVADDGEIVGHILLSRMSAEADGQALRALALAPVAVLPSRQGEGIGYALIEAAIKAARERGEQIIFVLGEPEFYGRFGFSASLAEPFSSPYAGPYFQALALTELAPFDTGIARYPQAFDGLE